MAVFVFDIETVPDVELGRRVFGLHDQIGRASCRERV